MRLFTFCHMGLFVTVLISCLTPSCGVLLSEFFTYLFTSIFNSKLRSSIILQALPNRPLFVDYSSPQVTFQPNFPKSRQPPPPPSPSKFHFIPPIIKHSNQPPQQHYQPQYHAQYSAPPSQYSPPQHPSQQQMPMSPFPFFSFPDFPQPHISGEDDNSHENDRHDGGDEDEGSQYDNDDDDNEDTDTQADEENKDHTKESKESKESSKNCIGIGLPCPAAQATSKDSQTKVTVAQKNEQPVTEKDPEISEEIVSSNSLETELKRSTKR